jgi:hypothetical protein
MVAEEGLEPEVVGRGIEPFIKIGDPSRPPLRPHSKMGQNGTQTADKIVRFVLIGIEQQVRDHFNGWAGESRPETALKNSNVNQSLKIALHGSGRPATRTVKVEVLNTIVPTKSLTVLTRSSLSTSS